MPVRTFISVDLPAPFSPSSAWISPAQTSRSTSWLAMTPGKYLAMPLRSTIGGVPGDRRAAVSAITFIGRLWFVRIARGSDPLHSFDRPIPVVELGFGHCLACGHLYIALGVLDLAGEGAPAAGDLRAHRVSLLADIFRNALAPCIAIDAAAHRQDGRGWGPFAFEPHLDLVDIEFLEVDHDRRDIGLRSEAANVGVPHHGLGAPLFRDLQVA